MTMACSGGLIGRPYSPDWNDVLLVVRLSCECPPFGICLGAPRGIASVGCRSPNFLGGNLGEENGEEKENPLAKMHKRSKACGVSAAGLSSFCLVCQASSVL